MVDSPLTGERMMDAVRSGDVAEVRRLLRTGEDPNSIGREDGWSVLMVAAEFLQPEVMRELLGAGADPNFTLADGWSVLHTAVDAECDAQNQTGAPADGRTVRVLLDAGADPDGTWTRVGGGQTPRELAAVYRNEVVMHAFDR